MSSWQTRFTESSQHWKEREGNRILPRLQPPFFLLPIKVTGVPYSRAEMAVHFPVPFCPALSRILGSRCVPSESRYLRMLAVISIRKESSSVLFQLSKAWVFQRDEIKSAALIFLAWQKKKYEWTWHHAAHLCHLIVVHTQNILHQVIGLTNQLHVAILNAIMDHLHKMPSTLISHLPRQDRQIIVRWPDNNCYNHSVCWTLCTPDKLNTTHPVATRFSCSNLGSDALEDVFYMWP